MWGGKNTGKNRRRKRKNQRKNKMMTAMMAEEVVVMMMMMMTMMMRMMIVFMMTDGIKMTTGTRMIVTFDVYVAAAAAFIRDVFDSGFQGK